MEVVVILLQMDIFAGDNGGRYLDVTGPIHSQSTMQAVSNRTFTENPIVIGGNMIIDNVK